MVSSSRWVVLTSIMDASDTAVSLCRVWGIRWTTSPGLSIWNWIVWLWLYSSISWPDRTYQVSVFSVW